MTVLSRLRAFRTLGAFGFIAVLLLVAAERRLAEFHFNIRTADVALENDDALGGDEIRVRLVALNDEQLPELSPARRSFEVCALATPSEICLRSPLGRPAPRGPPATLTSAT